MSPMSRSNMRDDPSIILNHKLMDGKQNNEAQTCSLSLFAPAWNTILQSSFPFGMAKYLIDDSNFAGMGAMYLLLMNCQIFLRKTCSPPLPLGVVSILK